MINNSFLKTFLVVFVVAFAANVAVAYIWDVFFHDSNWQWDTTTATAAAAGLVMTYILRRKNNKLREQI